MNTNSINQSKMWLPLWLDRCLQHHLNFPNIFALFKSECMGFITLICIKYNKIQLSFHQYSYQMVVKRIINNNPKLQNKYIKSILIAILSYDEEFI